MTAMPSRRPDAETPAIPITEAESQVMEVLWAASPRTAEEIVLALADTGWAAATVKTLLNRLLGKGAIRAEAEGRRYRYAPVLQREAWVRGQSEGLLARLFGGRLAPLVAHFGERQPLSRQDIAEIRRLLDRMEGDAVDGRAIDVSGADDDRR